MLQLTSALDTRQKTYKNTCVTIVKYIRECRAAKIEACAFDCESKVLEVDSQEKSPVIQTNCQEYHIIYLK